MKFRDLDHYSEVYQAKGLDFVERDGKERASRVTLADWWTEGKRDLQKAVSDGMEMRDTIATPDITPWLPQVIERNVLEAAEPYIVLNNLFERMGYEPGQAIQFPAMGALVAEDIGELESYPLVRLQESGATVTAKIGKSGISFEMSEEAMNHSRFDIMGMHLRACARALARLKEQKAANLITSLGIPVFDNVNPSTSVFGTTSGRGLDGSGNGSITLDDLFDGFGQVMTQGFTPDTLIMNPMSFVMFLKDPVLRAVMMAGGNQVWYGSWSGNAAKTKPGSRTHVSGGQKVTSPLSPNGTSTNTQNEFNTQLDSSPNLPSRWPWPLRIVVSPWIPFNPGTKFTDIILCDSAELGFYVEEHGVKVDRWNELMNDSTRVKLKERYTHQIANEGLAVAVFKYVKIVPNEIVFPAQTTFAMSGELMPLVRSTPIQGG